MSTPDRNYRSIADVDGFELTNETISPALTGENPAEFDDILKLSHARNGVVRGCFIGAAGLQRENAIDMNRNCERIVVGDCRLASGRQNAVTIKGGCRHIQLQRVRIVPGSGHCDIELGNWSDQSQERVTDVLLEDVIRTDGQPVRVRLGHADRPAIAGGNVRIDWFGSAVLKLYWWGKFCAHALTAKKATP